MRDTDADWREIGASFPYWGVLTAPEYRQETLDPAVLASFYATGRAHIAEVAARLAALVGGSLKVGKALDFGCGTGRLAEAMTDHADAVVGVDVSPGMLAEARRNGGGRVAYVHDLPEGPIDWINSFIVFQHIPPDKGLAILDRLLDRLGPQGLLSLHFTLYRDPHLQPPPASPPRGLAARLSRVRGLASPPHPVGAMMMYDYDLNLILAAIHARGVRDTLLVHTDHGGHHGVMIFGRRQA